MGRKNGHFAVQNYLKANGAVGDPVEYLFGQLMPIITIYQGASGEGQELADLWPGSRLSLCRT